MGPRLIACSLVLSAATARADCAPAAVPAGDPALVRSLVERLTIHGIGTTQTEGCPIMAVRIEQRGAQIHVALADAFQRTGERDVQDVATAAVIVESWLQQEVDDGSFTVPVPHTARTGLAVAAMSSLGTNATTWVGGSLAACLRVGPTCAGVLARGELDTTATGPSASVLQDSYVVTGFATLDLPLQLGGVVLSPGLAIGYGYLHVTTHHRDAMNNPLDVPTSDHELVTGAHASLLCAWTEHVSAFADLWTDVAVLRSDSTFGPTGAVRLSVGLRVESR
ncbi:MAG TPA: hypothetical protein VFQ65_33565 [Kofleriaceae bacterium]|nr:hypothetical protein [Kofleriaceae bacterium]